LEKGEEKEESVTEKAWTWFSRLGERKESRLN